MKRLVTTIGSAVQDVLFYSDELEILANPHKDVTKQKFFGFEFGAKLTSQDVHFTSGGGAINTAMTFARQAIGATVVTCVGHDAAGADVINLLKRNAIEHRLVQVHDQLPTAVSWVVASRKLADHVIFYYPGARSTLNINTSVVRKIKTPWIYLSSLTGVPKLSTSLQLLFQQAAKHESKVLWNPGSGELALGIARLKRYLSLTYILMVNLDEALQLLQSSGERTPNQLPVRTLIKKLHSFGSAITIITNGEKGAYVYDGRSLLYKSALKNIKVVNTTGAGDAFGSGFVSGLIRYKGNMSRALSLAVHNAGSVTTAYGAQTGILTTRQIERLNI